MEFRYLEVTVKSAEDLQNSRRTGLTTMDVYVVVSLSGNGSNQEKTSDVHQNCGTNARWDQTFSFKVDEAAALAGRLTLKFEIKDGHTLRGQLNVGWVDVPVQNLLEQGGGARDGESKVMRCDVRVSSRETQGVLEFSYRFGERFTADAADSDQRNADRRNQWRPKLRDVLMGGQLVGSCISSGIGDDND